MFVFSSWSGQLVSQLIPKFGPSVCPPVPLICMRTRLLKVRSLKYKYFIIFLSGRLGQNRQWKFYIGNLTGYFF